MWGWLAASVAVSSERFEHIRKLEKEFVRENQSSTGQDIDVGTDGIIVKKPVLTIGGGGEALDVYLSPAATPESRIAGFNINLHCATRFRPCTELCQVVPSAWRLFAQFQKANGWAVDQSPNCNSPNV
jgi:hypothetical protein